MNLGRHFEKYGDIKSVHIIEDFDGRSKGFGYIEFESKEIVTKALTADASEFEGRNLKVSIVRKREFVPKN
jgi:RNA recognition motif-containing protein